MIAAALAAGLAAGAVSAAAAPTPDKAAAAPTKVKAGPHRQLTRADFNGYWMVTNFASHLESVDKRMALTVEGEAPPFRPEAQAIYDKRIADARKGIAFADTDSRCTGPGMPRMMRGPAYPFFISQPLGKVLFNFEILHNVRWVYLNAKHPPAEDLDHNFQGDSVATWSGNVLNIDTVGLSAETTLDKLGMPSSEDLHVVEKMYLTGPDNLEDLITIDDPKTFTHVWQYKATYKRMPASTRIGEYVCQNNRNAPTADGSVGFDLKK